MHCARNPLARTLSIKNAHKLEGDTKEEIENTRIQEYHLDDYNSDVIPLDGNALRNLLVHTASIVDNAVAGRFLDDTTLRDLDYMIQHFLRDSTFHNFILGLKAEIDLCLDRPRPTTAELTKPMHFCSTLEQMVGAAYLYIEAMTILGGDAGVSRASIRQKLLLDNVNKYRVAKPPCMAFA